MAVWSKEKITTESGEVVDAQVPEIVSASRSTDIPAFYADWFFHRLKVGYSAWTNPFNGVKSYVSYSRLRFVVFWSKNPRPLLPHLEYLRRRGIGCYVQYSVNDYEAEGLERNVPPMAERIAAFKELVSQLGYGGVIWRNDPLILTDTISLDDLLEKTARIGDNLKGYTEKLVFSYADISAYKKVKANLGRAGVRYYEWTPELMEAFASRLAEMNRARGWNYELATCGERIDLGKYGIGHNHCIDDALIIRRAFDDEALMSFLKVRIEPLPQAGLFGEAEPLPQGAVILPDGRRYAMRGNNKDSGQREFCGCMRSKDIGEYNTCVHQCEYCYANTSKETAAANFRMHCRNPQAETITGK